MNYAQIPEKPQNAYCAQAAKEMLAVAKTYLAHAERLVYSYGSKTFLSGYDLFDNEGRGNIDCSTFVMLVLSGIPYEKSPYFFGSAKGMSAGSQSWAYHDLVDFGAIPDHYTSIAERIGRPYLAGPKGLDLKKAADMGVTVEMLADEIRATGTIRRSVYLAEYFLQCGACFTDEASAKPGDLVFYRSSGFFSDHERNYQGRAEINHVGIVSENPEMMINSSGSSGKEKPAVSLEPIFGMRKPVMFARFMC
ncbi:MAG: hypothetical protein IJM53_00790 [Lachnospiraceae bacterium]|nr:hypothetical protein [Lachnospiraceae bacterium]